MSSGFEFSGKALKVLDLIRNGRKNLFITGEAGTGKSTLLEQVVAEAGEEMVVLAPTGIAAIHVRGETLHSFFRLKPGYELDEARHMRLLKAQTGKYRALDTILIDEISMVRADVLDAVDVFLRRARESREHFGGVRMIFFGDLYQLPPVVTRDEEEVFQRQYDSPWFFSAHVFRKADLFMEGFQLERMELDHIYRQRDRDYLAVLNAIRNKRIEKEHLDYLRQFVRPDFEPSRKENWIHLVGTNRQALQINEARLAELSTPLFECKAVEEGRIASLQPNDSLLRLKTGAQVMFLNNDSYRRWVNGSIGTISGIFEARDERGELSHRVQVKLDTGKLVEVDQHTWSISKYLFRDGKFQREEIGSFTQLPFRLAWAITIHKSQGKTFHRVVLDLGGGSFAHGQCYVALSRLSSPEGLVLKREIRPSDVLVDPRILESR